MARQKQATATCSLLFTLLLLFAASCDNKGTPDTSGTENKSNSLSKSDSAQTDSTNIKAFANPINQIFVLYMDEADFRGLFSPAGGGVPADASGGKLSFQFTLGSNSSPLTLTVWPYQTSVYGRTQKVLKNDLLKWPLTVAEGDVIGGLKLTNPDVKKIKDFIDLPTGPNTEVISFRPMHEPTSGRITYEVDVYRSKAELEGATLINKANFIGPNTLKLNPSPPAIDSPDNIN